MTNKKSSEDPAQAVQELLEKKGRIKAHELPGWSPRAASAGTGPAVEILRRMLQAKQLHCFISGGYPEYRKDPPRDRLQGTVAAVQEDRILIRTGDDTHWLERPHCLGYFVEDDQLLYTESGGCLTSAEVTVPSQRRIVCRISRDRSGRSVLIPENVRRYRSLVILPDHEVEEMDAKLAAVEVTARIPALPDTSTVYFRGSVTEIFSSSREVDNQIRIAMADHGIPHDWPGEVLRQTERIPDQVTEADKAGRRDLTGLPLITIDGEDARDFDDAVYCEPLTRESGGWRLVVAIADVSYYVRPDTPLDAEAFKRGNSVYFPSLVVPMLPEKLSNGLCSLNPNVDRLCMVSDMIIDRSGRLESSELYPAVMRSHCRLTYTKVHAMLEGDAALAAEYAEIYPHVVNLNQMYLAMAGARRRRGVIEFESDEMKFAFDEEQRVEDMYTDPRYEAHKIIEECMIAANVAAADFIVSHKYKTLFRIHPEPDPEKVDAFRSALAVVGLSLGGGAKPRPADYAAFLDAIAQRPDAAVWEVMMLRSLAKAVYSPENCGHYALALKNYAHFTSPIRRYPDLMLHREIKYFLAQDAGEVSSGGRTPLGGQHCERARLVISGQHCSETERRADDATHQVEAWLKCDFMRDKIGQTFAGTVTNVVPFGLFVRLDRWSVDGLVYVANLGADYFTLSQDGMALVGSYTGLMYRMGDHLDVIISSIDEGEKRINFTLAKSSEGQTYKKKKKKSQKNGRG